MISERGGPGLATCLVEHGTRLTLIQHDHSGRRQVEELYILFCYIFSILLLLASNLVRSHSHAYGNSLDCENHLSRLVFPDGPAVIPRGSRV